MTDVQVFYEQLRDAANDFADAAFALETDAANLAAEDSGVAAPVGRYELKSALARRIEALRAAALAHQEASAALRTTMTDITDRYSELDVELTGEQQP